MAKILCSNWAEEREFDAYYKNQVFLLDIPESDLSFFETEDCIFLSSIYLLSVTPSYYITYCDDHSKTLWYRVTIVVERGSVCDECGANTELIHDVDDSQFKCINCNSK